MYLKVSSPPNNTQMARISLHWQFVVSLIAVGAANAAVVAPSLTPATWAALNATLGGRLATGIPFARSCFSAVGQDVGGSYDPTACAAVKNGYTSDGESSNFSL
jgi:hypothetical protein